MFFDKPAYNCFQTQELSDFKQSFVYLCEPNVNASIFALFTYTVRDTHTVVRVRITVRVKFKTELQCILGIPICCCLAALSLTI